MCKVGNRSDGEDATVPVSGGTIAATITVKDAALRLGCKPSSLYLAVQEGRLPCVRILGRIGLRETDVDEYGKTLGRANGYAARR